MSVILVISNPNQISLQMLQFLKKLRQQIFQQFVVDTQQYHCILRMSAIYFVKKGVTHFFNYMYHYCQTELALLCLRFALRGKNGMLPLLCPLWDQTAILWTFAALRCRNLAGSSLAKCFSVYTLSSQCALLHALSLIETQFARFVFEYFGSKCMTALYSPEVKPPLMSLRFINATLFNIGELIVSNYVAVPINNMIAGHSAS